MNETSPTGTKVIDEIEKQCNELGLSLSEVFIEAKLPYSTVQNWRKKDPKPFQTKKKIDEAIERLKTAKETAAANVSK